jgi:hypothetical protein
MTDETKCPICARRQPADGLVTCAPCLGRIDDDLARIVELTRLAADWVSEKGTSSATGGTRPVPGSRPPLNVNALDACLGLGGGILDPDPHNGQVDDRLPVMETLESWERMTREHYGLGAYGPASLGRSRALAAQQARSGVPGPPVTVKGSAGFLRAWLLRMAEDATFPLDDLAREVKAMRGDLEGLNPDKGQTGLRIDCPADHPDADGRLCGYHLRIEPAMPTQDVECRRCGTVWTSQRLVLVARFAPGGMKAWATAHELAEFLEVGHATVAKWARRGQVARMRTSRGWVYDIQQASQVHLEPEVAG